MKEVTIVITPRDRYSGVEACIQGVYEHTHQEFELWIVDLAYPKEEKEKIEKATEGRANARIFPLGLMIPMEAFLRVRDLIETPYVFFLDNDSRVTPNWLPPLLQCAKEENAALVNPLTLERKGVGDGPIRNHLYTNEVWVAEHENIPYLIEYKSHLRVLPEEVPKKRVSTQFFELHGVLFETKAFQEIELPHMVIREHIDIGMQLKARGRKLLTEPKSVVIFDNLAERMTFADIRFLSYRWSRDHLESSSRLFEKRWGYNFYSEQFIKNWTVRRKIFSVARWFYLPIWVSDLVTRAYKKIFLRDWDPCPDIMTRAKRLYDTLPRGIPLRKEPAA